MHIHTPFIAHYAGVRFAREHGLPVVATYHTFFEDYLHHYVPILPRGIGRWIARRFTLSQCADVAALISPSAPMRDALLAYGVTTPIEVLPTGLAAESFVRGDGARFRKQFALPADRPLLLYVGRVAFEKNIDFLLRMFVRVRARRPDALFVIAGEGPALRASESNWRASLASRTQVRFIGYLDRSTELPDCYAAGDAFVFASRTETQGLVLLEAMAQGTPVVSTAELGTRSILTPDCGAFVVPEAGGSLRGGGDAGAETRARCAAPRAVASARRILGVAGDGAPACVVLREGKQQLLQKFERGPIGTPFRVERSSWERSS